MGKIGPFVGKDETIGPVVRIGPFVGFGLFGGTGPVVSRMTREGMTVVSVLLGAAVAVGVGSNPTIAK